MSSESHRALFSAMLFLLLFHCSNTQMDSPPLLDSVCESCPCVSLSVCHSARMARKASPPMHSEISLGILDGNFSKSFFML